MFEISSQDLLDVRVGFRRSCGRIRMRLAGLRYERQPGEALWRRVDDADFDVLDDAAA